METNVGSAGAFNDIFECNVDGGRTRTAGTPDGGPSMLGGHIVEPADLAPTTAC